MTVERMHILWRLKTFIDHGIRNASKGITLALFSDVVVLISIGVDLGHGLRLYREEANIGKETTHSIQCIDAQSSMMV
jgi:hypothetical protein